MKPLHPVALGAALLAAPAFAEVPDDLMFPTGDTLVLVLERLGYDCGVTGGGWVCTGDGEVWICEGGKWLDRCVRKSGVGGTPGGPFSPVDAPTDQPFAPIERARAMERAAGGDDVGITARECLLIEGSLELHDGCTVSGVKCTIEVRGREVAACID